MVVYSLTPSRMAIMVSVLVKSFARSRGCWAATAPDERKTSVAGKKNQPRARGILLLTEMSYPSGDSGSFLVGFLCFKLPKELFRDCTNLLILFRSRDSLQHR